MWLGDNLMVKGKGLEIFQTDPCQKSVWDRFGVKKKSPNESKPCHSSSFLPLGVDVLHIDGRDGGAASGNPSKMTEKCRIGELRAMLLHLIHKVCLIARLDSRTWIPWQLDIFILASKSESIWSTISYETTIQQHTSWCCHWFSYSESYKKMEKQRNLDAQNIKAQLDSIHDVLDTKARMDSDMKG